MRKILLVSHNALSLHNNNGKTLTSIFEDWDAECIAQIYFNKEIPQAVRFSRFFRVTDADVLKRLFSFGCVGGGRSVMPVRGDSGQAQCSSVRESALVRFIRRNEAGKLVLRDFLFGSGFWVSAELKRWFKDFQADSVFFVGGNSRFSFFVAEKLAAWNGVPLDIYITDDYVLNADPQGWLAKYLLRKLRVVYRDVFLRARHVFVIGEDMASAFSLEYGRKFIPIMNSVTIPSDLSVGSAVSSSKGCIDFVYAGGLHLGREESLVKFGCLLQNAGRSLGVEVRLTVYSLQRPSDETERRFLECGVVFGGALGQDAIAVRLANSDFVLHVESFEDRYRKLTKLSVSTKIPEYLVSGACLVAFGPSELASIRLVEKNSLGVTLSERDSVMEMQEKLISVIESRIVRDNFARKGYEYAKRQFDSELVRQKVKSLLNW